MKSHNQILKRLKKLRLVYAKQYIEESQKRIHHNCEHNCEQEPLNVGSSDIVEFEITPRQVTSLVIIQDPAPIRICMYGSEDIETWPGSICDNDDISSNCKWFKPRISASEAKEEFLLLLGDDEYVLNNYKDFAALQWAINDRIYKHELSWVDKLFFWLNSFIKPVVPKQLSSPGETLEDLPKDLWSNDSSSHSGTRSP